ncbi:MAG: DUF309 domain-containing protein [Halobacteriales archaeon]
MRDRLRAGVAVYNAGRYHAAHDAWEDHWLGLESGTDDERFLHGLIQFTAAVHHARHANWSGATGLADSAGEYLADLPPEYRGVTLGTVRAWLGDLRTDPEVIERRSPPALRVDGVALAPADLDLAATGHAAAVLAEADGYDAAVLADAARYARADVAADVASSPVLALLFDFVREPADRAIVFERLAGHVDRRRSRETDVDGLFDGASGNP